MITKILVPTDGSETAKKAAEYAFSVAAQCNAEVVILGVIDRSPFVGRVFVPVASAPTHLREPIEDFLKNAAETDVAEIVELAKKQHISATAKIRHGHAVEEIVKEAEESGADLIVISSHGRSALEAALLGSVTFGVIHKDTRIPVLVVRR
jgi:nucleotide-binding universal stress UspA family protein